MTWLSHTFFRAAVLILWLSLCTQAQTTVSGTVRLTDSHSRDLHPKHDYSNVAVWLDPVNAAPAPVRRHAVMLQKDKHFTPHVLVVERGATIDFPNQDPIFHNAFSNFDGQIFDIGLYPPGTSRSVAFHRAGVVRVFCNIHSTMSAIIVVVDTPYHTSTLKDGAFAIPKVAPGDYVLHFFHERALPETLQRLERPVSVGSEPINVGSVAISEAGYLPSSHKNKYGREYPSDTGVTAKYGSADR